MNRGGLFLAACLLAATGVADPTALPLGPALDTELIRRESPLVDLRFPRLAAQQVRRLVADGKTNQPIVATLWPKVLACQLWDKTTQACWYEQVELRDDGIEIVGALVGGEFEFPCRLRLQAGEPVRQRVRRADRDRALAILLRGTVGSVRTTPTTGSPKRLAVTWQEWEVLLCDEGRPFFRAKPPMVTWLEPVDSPSPPPAADGEPTAEPVAVIEGEDFDGVRLFADWEPSQRGWYGRLLCSWSADHQYSGEAVAVVHPAAVNHAMSARFASPLPPGRYEVLLDVSYQRNRLDDNIVTVQLGEIRHTFGWFLPPASGTGPDQEGMVRGPIFRLRRPATGIRIVAEQFGGGCLAEAPAFPERFIMVDRVIVRRLLE